MAIVLIIPALGLSVIGVYLFVRLLCRCHIYPKVCVFLAFTLFGVVLGAITVAVPDSDVRQFINPFGVQIADWGRSGSWLAGYPQAYFFTTLFSYAVIGVLINVGFLLGNVDMNRYFGRIRTDV